MTRAFSLDRARKGKSLVLSSPGTLWSLSCPHSTTQILFYHRMLLGLLWCHKILPPSHPRPLSLGQEESIIPSSLITPTVARRTPHQNTFSLLRDPRGNTGGGERGRRMTERQPVTFGRMRAHPSILWKSHPNPTPLQETTSQELQGTEQTQVEHGSHPTWDNIMKRTRVIREEGKTMFKTCPPPPHTHTCLFLASTWSKQWSQPKPRSVNNAWSQLRPPTQEGVPGGTDGRLTHTGHRSAMGAEMPAPPQCSSVTRQENVGLPQRAMKCEARSYEWMGKCQLSWGRHQELEWFVSPFYMS